MISGLKYSGANDNASGVGVLLEIVRLWQETGYRPQRSVLFAAWGAQEIGQLGSRYYLEHPTIPLKNVVGMIQLDGVGGGGGFNPGIQASPEQDGLLLYSMAVAEQLLDEKITITSKLEQSDHITFDDNGIPSMLVSWRLAGEMNLPDDIANGVSSTRLGIIGRLVTLALMSLVR
jgi:Zn-dependent M28 family amino/carboxypeptidase